MSPSPVVTPEILEAAYCQGVFPMGDPETGELAWYQPEPRTLIDLERFHVPRRLAKTIRSGKFRFTVNQAFDRVIRECARARRPDGMWITTEIVALYCRMHELGKAHSVEAWVGEELVGGLYGVAFGGAFMGESMFHVVRDASKACLVHLVERLRERGYVLLDTQFPTPHLSQFGLILLPHAAYLNLLHAALQLDRRFDAEEIRA
ncbi:leucyl/phenylalanyl-tRNA--protein transferase [Candidatus Sumerlaeota bacterium]|nr:leucyl/phenylalanyl-tRNA--protein transferase [Candidatus Sumerlaeota bacterium]